MSVLELIAFRMASLFSLGLIGGSGVAAEDEAASVPYAEASHGRWSRHMELPNNPPCLIIHNGLAEVIVDQDIPL